MKIRGRFEEPNKRSAPTTRSLPLCRAPGSSATSSAGSSLLGMKGSLVALNAALKLVLYLLNKYCRSCLSCSLGLWG